MTIPWWKWLLTGLGLTSLLTKRQPISDLPALIEFIDEQAAYVGQTALYGYLQTRMGTQSREIFQDDQFAPGIIAARDQVVSACTCDLCVFSAALIDPNERPQEIARVLLAKTSVTALSDLPRFAKRLALIEWATVASEHRAFTASPDALVDAAPVSDAFKASDAEILRNSIRFRWNNVIALARDRYAVDELKAAVRREITFAKDAERRH